MSNTLLEIFDKFGNSKAVFIGNLVSSGDIEFNLKERYDVKTADVDHSDPVVQLMVANYQERFEQNLRCFKKMDSCMLATYRDIFIGVKQAFVNASPLKNPRQSKLYKWFTFDTINSHNYFREGMIALYRYIYKHAGDEFKFDGDAENPHAQNVVAILEKIKEKYEQK